MLQYFSTLERLRLAQEPVCTITPVSPGLTRKRSIKKILPCLNRDPGRSRAFLGRRFGRPPPFPTDHYSQADAQWFMNLPDKVQRKQFTREEQILLAGRGCEGFILPDAADEVFYRLGNQRNQSLPTLETSSFSSQSSLNDSLQFGVCPDCDSEVEMEESIMDSFRWLDDEDELDLNLDDYHKHIASTSPEVSTKASSRRPSFRASISLTHLPFGASKNSSTYEPPHLTKSTRPRPSQSSQTTPHIASQHLKSKFPRRSTSKPPTPRPSFQTARPVIETPTQYYQDPEARLKLRVYLASPQKFDEAIEFGFPSLQTQEINPPLTQSRRPSATQSAQSGRPSLSNSRRPSVAQNSHSSITKSKPTNTVPPLTWFHDEDPSLLNALDSDSESSNLPETPQSPNFRDNHYHIPQRNATSTDSYDPLHPRRHHLVKPHTPVLAGGREMTLRMTLTRPDLRQDDDHFEAIYGTKVEDDPLALEQLPPLVSGSEIWDSLPVREGVVKKLWQKVSRRGGT